MTLFQAVQQLYDYGSILLSAFILMFIIVVPAVLLLCITFVLTPIVVTGVYARGSILLGKLLFHAEPWSMAQVFLIGVLVSMIKIGSMATVVMGVSFWGYVGFTIFITLTLSTLDSHEFWETIDEVRT